MKVIYIDESRCTGCGACTGLCPRGAIAMENGVAAIADNLCNECHDCLDSCPQGAIVLVEPVPASALQTLPSRAELVSGRYPREPSSFVHEQLVPAVQAALVWAGREVLPRLAGLAVDWIDRQQVQRTPARTALGETGGAASVSEGPGRRQQGQRRRKRHRQRGPGRSSRR
jgi:Fe-S-cluster-containing hydrogenase component 2